MSETQEVGAPFPEGCLPMVGLGFDVHAFSDEDPSAPGALPLMLAGLEWPGERRLSGHSDGDAVAHAVWMRCLLRLVWVIWEPSLVLTVPSLRGRPV